MEAILAERSVIVASLIASGVPARDRADVEQGILLGAWRSVRQGRYRPDPKADPRAGLRGWLYGICWRHVSHYLKSAYVRRMVLSAQPLGWLHEPVGPSLEAQVAARETLLAIESLKPWQIEALLSVDDPESLAAYARRRRMNQSTAASRLRLAREALSLRLRRLR
ncbi:sigma-70 family RNA polymerase sigma factor [Sorangium sp. So ce321]|uniref:sigma-70 family RNA polymerase sigma factor n=1 Tax=Sorangium sp. So ce321 TaxID=3133300 RepID=UPI003F5E03DB